MSRLCWKFAAVFWKFEVVFQEIATSCLSQLLQPTTLLTNSFSLLLKTIIQQNQNDMNLSLKPNKGVRQLYNES